MTSWLNLTDEQRRVSLVEAETNSGIKEKAIGKTDVLLYSETIEFFLFNL